ncbi:hypothetical protein [Tritonibacter scottomollicae]|nr:hypothetical protein [Tritonibacter scottomollicae]
MRTYLAAMAPMHSELNSFGNDIDLGIVEAFIRVARERLERFEDGSSLTKARTNQ